MRDPSSDPPFSVRLLDLVTVGALLIGLTVYVTGGFREWTPFGRLSVTSWIRPLVLAAIVAAVRHALRPRPTIVTRLRAGLRALAARPEVRAVMPIAVSTRAGVLLVGFLAVVVFGYRPDVAVPWRIYENEFLNLPARWDSGWYLGIAMEGYQWSPARAETQQNIAFFPLYPMLMRYSSLLFGRETLWAGVLISWAAFGGALIYLYRLGRDWFGEEQAAAGAALLACYPFALYYSTAYTEGIFLLAMAGACYHFERDELWPAGAWGLAAGLSRPNGCLLTVVLALMVLRRVRPVRGPAGWARLADRMAVAAMPGIGMLLYSTYIFFLTGHPFRWVMQNAAWGRVYQSLDALALSQARTIGDDGLYTFAATRTTDALQLAAVLFVLAAVWPVYRRLGAPYAALILVNVLPPLTMGGLLSMGRVTSTLFPAFLWLGAAIPAAQRPAWLVGFAMLQAIAAAMFFTWRPLF